MGEIQTDRLLLRPWSMEFEEDMVRLCADANAMTYINRGHAIERAEAVEISNRGEQLWEEYGYGPWAALHKVTGEWVGRMGLNLLADWPGPHKWEVGWELLPSFWGQGYATEGGQVAVRFGFEVAELGRIISATVPEHTASRRVMEKCGLLYQGVVQYRNTECVWYALDRSDFVQTNLPPLA